MTAPNQPLTPEQVELIRTSYEALSPRGDHLLNTFFDNLFESTPSMEEVLPRAGIAKRRSLLKTVSFIVDNADRLEGIRNSLMDMGEHNADTGIKSAHYPLVRDTLVATMAQVAGDAWTQQLDEAWFDVLSVVSLFMIRGAERRAERKQAA